MTMRDSLPPEQQPGSGLSSRLSPSTGECVAQDPRVAQAASEGPSGASGEPTWTEEERDDLIDLLPTDMILWPDDEELTQFPNRTYDEWRDILGHPRAHRGCCKTCGCATPCLLAVFHDSVISSVVRELARLDALRTPHPRPAPAVCTGEEGLCDVHGYDRHPTAPDGLREQYMAAIIRGGGCVDLAAATDAVLAVRDAELLRLRAETATYRLQIDDLIRRNSEYAERAIANGERADKADRALEQQLADARAETATADRIRADVQRDRDRLAATVEWVRRLAERWENAPLTDRSYARALRTTLNEPSDGAGADTARRCGSTLPHPGHTFMRLHVVFNCPGTTPKDPS